MCPQKGEKGGRLTTDQDTINGGSQEGGFGYPVSVLVWCGGGLYCIGLRCRGLTNRQIVSKANFPQTTGSTISYVWLQILQLNSGLKRNTGTKTSTGKLTGATNQDDACFVPFMVQSIVHPSKEYCISI